MKFKKKALIINCIKWTGENVQEVVDFTNGKVKPFPFASIQITTDWGVMECKVGDMVMKGLSGEIYSCDADVFSKSYEHVEGINYKKVPIIIEAVQLLWKNWNEICNFVPKEVFVTGCYLDENNKSVDYVTEKLGLKINTLEGEMLAKETDWIIKGVKGEYYFNDDEMFNKIFEKID